MKQRKPLPRAAVFGLIVAAALLVAFLGYSLLVKPQKSRLADVKQQIQQTQATIDQYKQQAAAVTHPSAAPKIRVADVYRLARAMPSAVDMPDILLELDSVAQSAGVTIDSVTPATPSPGNGFQILALNLQFHGDFYALTDFLFRLRGLVAVQHGQLLAGGRLFAVQNVTLAPDPSAPHSLTVQATVDTYVYGSTAAGATSTTPAAAPATTPATTTSSTTTTTTTTASASAEGAP